MKKLLVFILAITGSSLCVRAQNSYPFDVKISGTGNQNIILIPGLSCSGDVWNETVTRYDKEYRCYTLTFHGFAGIAPDDSVSFKNWETSVARYIHDKKMSKPIIIGHSIGGGMALMLAADYPELVSKIIVVDALPCLGAIQNPAFVVNPHPDCTPFVANFQSMDDRQFYQMQKRTMSSLMADTVHLEEVIHWSVTSDRKTLAEIYCQFLNTDMREQLSTIQCPSLILMEGAFSRIKPDIAEQYKNLKTARLEYATKGLHFIMYDDTDWYFKQLDQFLK
ncbi:MAG: alpha/beta hydrolase [Ginsengibacter sp.]